MLSRGGGQKAVTGLIGGLGAFLPVCMDSSIIASVSGRIEPSRPGMVLSADAAERTLGDPYALELGIVSLRVASFTAWAFGRAGVTHETAPDAALAGLPRVGRPRDGVALHGGQGRAGLWSRQGIRRRALVQKNPAERLKWQCAPRTHAAPGLPWLRGPSLIRYPTAQIKTCGGGSAGPPSGARTKAYLLVPAPQVAVADG